MNGAAEAAADAGRPPPAWQVIALTAAAYALAGWLALRLAVAPGFASPLYPSAGIALAAALVFGRPALAGVALGAFVTNLLLGSERGQLSWLLPALIGLGAMLQAAAGAALVQRFVAAPLALTAPRDLLLFFVLGAPVACLLNTTLGTAVLAGGGLLQEGRWAATWRTWWVGDTLGVLIGAPLALTLIARPRELWAPRRATVALPLLLATLLLAAAWLQIERSAAQRAAAAFERDAFALAETVSRRLSEPLAALRAMHGVYVAHTEVSPAQFRRAAAEWLTQPLFLQAAGWSARVLRSDLAAFEASAQQAGLTGYRVFDRPDGPSTAGDADVVAIRFIEPGAGNEGALGVNALSIPAARAAILSARDSDRLVATGGFRLTQSTREETGLVIYRAIFDGQPADQLQRRAAWRGVIFVTLRVEAMLDALLAAAAPPRLHWCLLDRTPAAARPRLAGPAGCEDRRGGALTLVRPVDFAGRPLELHIDADPDAMAGVAEGEQRAAIAAAGLCGAALLGALLLVVSGQRWRVEQLVGERTAALRTEVTERERAVAALRDSEARLRNILDHVPIGVLYCDLEGRIREANPRLCSMLGLDAAALPDHTLEALTHPDDRGEDALLLGRLRDGRLPLVRRRKRLRAADGRTLWVQMVLTLMRDEAGRPRRLLGVVEDITDSMRVQAAETARERAEAARRAQGELVSRMSHELRTPLNAMLGFAQLLALDREPPLGAHQRRWTAEIERAGWHLLELIDETLDLSLIENGALTLDSVAVELAPLLQAARDTQAAWAAQQGVTIELEVAPGLPPVQGDAARLRQVVEHLLSNAVKYNVRNGRVDMQAQAIGGVHVELVVRDSGIGMSAEQLAALFQPFDRLGRESSGLEGSGVGLALARRLAELMGGSLAADSRPGEGSVFTLTLTLAQAQAQASGSRSASADRVVAASPAPSAPGGAPSRLVHYIEDNTTNVEVMRAVLAQRPAVRMEVSSLGLDGLAAVRTRQPDLILLDMQLPDIDGLELLRHLKHGADTAAIPVLVVSADAARARMELALAAGAAGYLDKPLDIPDFLATVDRLLGTPTK